MQLKDMYSLSFLQDVGRVVSKYDPTFNVDEFISDCLQPDWEDLKLMERSDRVTVSLHRQFPTDFEQAAPLLKQVGPHFTGLVAVCFPNYVAKYGLNHWETSMELLKLLTRYSTGEFAIRPFLVKYPEATSKLMLSWSLDKEADVRRLASEGMRPRLPWGIRLNQYIADPSADLKILHNLIFDQSEYVQKSVANNLNDISKDNPQVVIAFAKKYWHQTERTDWVLNRGLRTLFKKGVPEVLTLLGYDSAALKQLKKAHLTTTVKTSRLGDVSKVHYSLTSQGNGNLPVYLGYRIHYVRQNKTDSFKDFFIKRINLKANQTIGGDFNLKWQQLSTRRLYPGEHVIELLVNTKVVAQLKINLLPEKNAIVSASR